MEETTLNQEQESTTTTSNDDGFFDDITDDDLVDTPVEGEAEVNAELEGEQNSTDVEEPQDNSFLDIRYNKEDVHLNRDQAIEYAQKGMNYDKLNERYSNLNSNLERLANANGLSVDDFLNRLEETQWNYEVSKELDSLMEQYPIDENASEEQVAERKRLLQELAEARTSQRLGENQRQQQAQFEEEQSAYQQEALNDLERFNSVFPNVLKLDGGNPLRDIPQEVLQMADENHDLTRSYGLWRAKQAELNKPIIEAKQKAQQLNTLNQSRNIGSTTNVGNVKKDDFISGWDSED